MNYEYNKKIKTMGELKNYIGKILCFEYKSHGEHILYMKKLTKLIPSIHIDNNMRCSGNNVVFGGCGIFGTNLVIFKTFKHLENKYPKLPYCKYLYKEKISSSFDFVRTPTQKEMKQYFNALRYARIFGINLKKSI